MWCLKEIDKEYRRRMYRILNLYSEDYNPKYHPKYPVICFDEKYKPPNW
jgi:hypothetical protein